MVKNVLRHSNLLGRHLAISVLCTVFLLLYSHTYSRAKSSPHQAVLHSELSGGQMIKSLQCFANNDLFAVGGRNDQGPPARLLRFDGRQWHETKIVSLGGFNGIWGSSPLHVFAVGGLPGEIWYYNGEGWHLSYRGGPLDNLHGVWGGRRITSGSWANIRAAAGSSSTTMAPRGPARRILAMVF